MTDSCATCFYVRSIAASGYECRRNVPTPLILSGQKWRQVLATDWCGEFSTGGPAAAWDAYSVGVGDSKSVVPVGGALTDTLTTVRWTVIEKTVFYGAAMILTDVGTASGDLRLPPPVAGMKTSISAIAGAGHLKPTGVPYALFALNGIIQISTQVGLYVNGNELSVSGFYQIN